MQVRRSVAEFGSCGLRALDAAKAAVHESFFCLRELIPVFLLTIFAKNEKANLAPKERALLIAAAKRIAAD